MNKKYVLGGFDSSDPDIMVDELIRQLKSEKPIGLSLDKVWEKLQVRIRNYENENAQSIDHYCFRCRHFGKTCWPCLPFVLEEGCKLQTEKEEKEVEVRFNAKKHQLKTWIPLYQDILEERKLFDFRKNDRDFQVGDILVLNEWRVTNKTYTGRSVSMRVTYMFEGLVDIGMPPGYCIMGIRRIK